MDPNLALVSLLNATKHKDMPAFWQAIEDLQQASAEGRMPEWPSNAVILSADEIQALNTLCELELGSKEQDRIAAWNHIYTAQLELLRAISDYTRTGVQVTRHWALATRPPAS